MKKHLSIISAALAAAIFTLASCQKVGELESPVVTHTVKFKTEFTKTSYIVEGNKVIYNWEESDIARISIFEDGIKASLVDGIIEDSQIFLEAVFEGSAEGSHIYNAELNGCVVKPVQTLSETGKYDSDSDVLVTVPVSSDELGDDGIYTFRFGRPAAIAELKIKGLKPGETVSKVTVASDSDNPLAGKYIQDKDNISDGNWENTSNKIVINFPEPMEVDAEGILPVQMVSMPIENASVKVLVETGSGLKYRKTTAAALTLKANGVKSQGISLADVTPADKEDGWHQVTGTDELFDGDTIRIACPDQNMIACGFAVNDKAQIQVYLDTLGASFADSKLTGVNLAWGTPQNFILSEEYDNWNILSPEGEKLCASAVKSLKYDVGEPGWAISFDADGYADIASATSASGAMKYNHTSPRFLNYASGQDKICIFKKYGEPAEIAIKPSRTASFTPSEATVTVGADDNVFPILTFDPDDAAGGEQTWSSSNTDIATVDAETGEVTLIAEGKTTISVSVGESDTYQPCAAQYELTVKPAAVEGLDVIDWSCTGVTAYAGWEYTGSASGNEYAGYSTKFASTEKNNKDKVDAIQLRTEGSNSGIVVTSSAHDKVAAKVTVEWNSYTSGRTLDIYGKNTAYESPADLYGSSSNTQGTKLGSIASATSTELVITGSYKYIGLRSYTGALYLNQIKIQWTDDLPEYENLHFEDAEGNTVTEVNVVVGQEFTAPALFIGDAPAASYTLSSSDADVVSISSEGAYSINGKGSAVITATVNGDSAHKTTAASFTINVSNVLSSIAVADDSSHPTRFYVGDAFSFAGIKLTAGYNDGDTRTIADTDLTDDNFSGFNSSAAAEEQPITVSYTENGTTVTTSYNVEIIAATTYDIVLPEADANGNVITAKVNGQSADKAAEGDEVVLCINPAASFELTAFEVDGVNHLADVNDNEYSFTMPAKDVTVTAEFNIVSIISDGMYAILAQVGNEQDVNFWYMSCDLGTAATKRFQRVDSGSAVLPETITTDNESILWTVENTASGIIISSCELGTQISWTSGNSAALANEGKVLTVENSKTTTGAFNISFKNDTGTRNLKLNTNTGQEWFAFYTTVGDLYFVPATVDSTPSLSLNVNTIDGVDANGATDATVEDVYKLKNAQDSDIQVSVDGTVVTAASVAGGNLTYSAGKNDGAARSGWVKLTLNDTELTITVKQSEGGTSTSTIDFESTDLSVYTDWTFEKASSATGTITAHGGTYYGTNGGNQTLSITTKNKITPRSLKFYVSKASNNTTPSSWDVQVSSDKEVWTTIKSQEAQSMASGVWVEVTVDEDFEDYSNVYLRIYYSNSGAKRAIDDITLVYVPGAKEYSVNVAPDAGGEIIASPLSGIAGTEITLSANPDTGYEFSGYTVADSKGNPVSVSDNKFILPEDDVTVSGTFSQIEYSIAKADVENGSFTVKNGDEEEISTAKYNEYVYVSATPADGYILSAWNVTKAAGGTVSVSNGRFKMPAGNVTVAPVFQASQSIPVYDNLENLVAAGTPTGQKVTVTLNNEIITRLQGTRGIYVMVGNREIELYGDINFPSAWVAGGSVSGTVTCPWKVYSSTWELCPESWEDITYLAPCPAPEITIDNSGNATIGCTEAGATIKYGIAANQPSVLDNNYSAAVTLTDGQTIWAQATKAGFAPSPIVSATYTATSGGGGDAAEPFEWTGGTKSTLTGMAGVTATGLGSDYAESNAPYRVKLDDSGDNIIIEVGFEIKSVQLLVKMLGGATTSSITIQESTSKTGTFTDVQTMSISGEKNAVVDFTTTNAFKTSSRVVKLYFTKGSNVGLGYIKITPTN